MFTRLTGERVDWRHLDYTTEFNALLKYKRSTPLLKQSFHAKQVHFRLQVPCWINMTCTYTIQKKYLHLLNISSICCHASISVILKKKLFSSVINHVCQYHQNCIASFQLLRLVTKWSCSLAGPVCCAICVVKCVALLKLFV